MKWMNQGFLTDRLLIATHGVNDGCFDKTLIYICAHNENGALGLVVNMPLHRLGIKSLLDELRIHYIDHLPDYPIHFGGPVDTNQGFILHSNDRTYPGSIAHESGICFSAGIGLLEDVATGCGPSKMIVALGSAGWAAGQLEQEIEAGSWLIAPASEHLLFDLDASLMWQAAASSLGVDLDRLSLTIGHA